MGTRKEKRAKIETERNKRSYNIDEVVAQATAQPDFEQPDVYSVNRPMTTQAWGQEEPDVDEAMKMLNPNKLSVPKVTPITTQAQIQNPTGGLPSATEYAQQQAEKRKGVKSPFSDLLAPLREAAIQEKTDAQKMQKYYALSDVFNALGKMGGAAVGGAIGGNMLDSAPTVGEYKESRGYLDAFERAKKANERLRDLDAQEFQLAYSKKQRDEERAHSDKVRAEDRKYKAELDKADKEWQKIMIDYKAKIDQAAATGNIKLKAQLEAEAQAAAWQHQLKRDALLHRYDMDEKKISKDIVAMQMGSVYGKPTPFTFNDGTAISIPEKVNEEMLKYFAQKGNIGGVSVDADNVADVLRNHPNLVNDFLNYHGMGVVTQEPQAASSQTNKDAAEEIYYYTNPITNKSVKAVAPMREYKETTQPKHDAVNDVNYEESTEDYNARFKSKRKR